MQVWGGETKSDPNNCISSPAICQPGYYCNQATEACALRQAAPTSFIFPGGLAFSQSFPSVPPYTIAGQGQALVYYTLDGTELLYRTASEIGEVIVP